LARGERREEGGEEARRDGAVDTAAEKAESEQGEVVLFERERSRGAKEN